jgi:hypothetical protein
MRGAGDACGAVKALDDMFTKTDKRFPWGWIAVLVIAMGALIELWMREYLRAASTGVFAIVFAVLTAKEGSPPGRWIAALWWLLVLLAALTVARVMHRTGFL